MDFCVWILDFVDGAGKKSISAGGAGKVGYLVVCYAKNCGLSE